MRKVKEEARKKYLRKKHADLEIIYSGTPSQVRAKLKELEESGDIIRDDGDFQECEVDPGDLLDFGEGSEMDKFMKDEDKIGYGD